MKFTLTAQDGLTKITHEFDSYFLHETVKHLDKFLKSADFPIQGELGILENKPYDEINIDLTPYDYEINSTFSAIVDDHIDLTGIYPDAMSVNLTGSGCIQSGKQPCKNCGCGNSNAN